MFNPNENPFDYCDSCGDKVYETTLVKVGQTNKNLPFYICQSCFSDFMEGSKLAMGLNEQELEALRLEFEKPNE